MGEFHFLSNVRSRKEMEPPQRADGKRSLVFDGSLSRPGNFQTELEIEPGGFLLYPKSVPAQETFKRNQN